MMNYLMALELQYLIKNQNLNVIDFPIFIQKIQHLIVSAVLSN